MLTEVNGEGVLRGNTELLVESFGGSAFDGARRLLRRGHAATALQFRAAGDKVSALCADRGGRILQVLLTKTFHRTALAALTNTRPKLLRECVTY